MAREPRGSVCPGKEVFPHKASCKWKSQDERGFGRCRMRMPAVEWIGWGKEPTETREMREWNDCIA